jgi:tetratricopeptide (TPR) repeat protein
VGAGPHGEHDVMKSRRDRKIWRCAPLAGACLLLAACAGPGEPRPAIAVPAAPPPAPETSAGAYLAGRAAQGRHDLAQASTYLGEALALDGDNVEILHRTAIAFAMQGRIEEAAKLASRLEAFDEESTVPAMLLAERRAKAGDWAGLAALLDHLPPRGLNTYLLPLCRAWAKVGQGQTDEAILALQPLEKVQGLATLRDFNLGLINDLAGRAEAAEKSYRAVLAGGSGRTLRTVGIVAGFLRRSGQGEEARQLLEGFHRDHPDMPPIEVPDQRQVNDAADGMAEAFFGAALTLRQANLPDLALFFSQLALDLQPEFPLARVMAGDILSNLDQLDASNRYYRSIAAASPYYRTAQLRVARNLEEADKVEESAALLRRLGQSAPEQADAFLALGDMWRRQRRWLDAVDAYDKALELIKGDARAEWPVYYARGVALERANLWPRAEADLLRALQLQPDEPQVLNYLGYSWIEQGTNLARATEMIEKAVTLRPQDGFIVDSLGWAFYRSGDFKRAVETLQRAVSLEPGDAAINDHLGDALWSAGRTEEARFQWRHALQSDPDPELKAQVAEKLKQSGGNRDPQ